MEEYFSTTLNKLKTNNYATLNIVLGNESCDLDSAISALVYAVFLNWQHNQIKCKVCTVTNRAVEYKDDIFVSVLDVRREDFPLKTEVVFSLKQYGITEKDLIFSDDINLEKLVTEGNTNIVLVDHHSLSKRLDYLAPHVNEIIDHRPLDRTKWAYREDVRSTMEVVGSCCTLVSQRIKDLSVLVARDVDFFNAYPPCTNLLRSVILLDTVNFSREVNKATRQDVDTVLFLESILMLDGCESERKTRLDHLLAARCDVSSLTSAQLLRKDLKILGNILVPTFPILVKEFLQKPEAIEAVTLALASHNCVLAVLLGMKLSDGLKRDATIIGKTGDNKAEMLARFLQEWSNPPLQLSPDPEVHSFYFNQMNLSASRKQYMPALNEFINNCK